MVTYEAITAGWTEKLTFRLGRMIADVFVPFGLDGYTVTLILRDGNGALVTPGGAITKLDQAEDSETEGSIEYLPKSDGTDFNPSNFTNARPTQPYQVKWKVVDGAGRVVFFPSGEADILPVNRA